MGIRLRIALRYVLTLSQQTVINRINSIALLVVVVASLALLVVLSAFEGLKVFSLSYTESLNPNYEILPKNGKTFTVTPAQIEKLKALPEVVAVAPVVEEKVFLSFEAKNQVAYLKGVPSDYPKVVAADSLVVVGEWSDFEDGKVVVGYGIAAALGLGVFDYDAALNLSVPKAISSGPFSRQELASVASFVVGLYQLSEEVDNTYVFAGLDFVQDFLGLKKNTYSQLELKTLSNDYGPDFTAALQALFSEPIEVRGQKEMNAAFYKMLNTENLAVYLIFTLVLIIAMFNVIGALIMMRLDKWPQVKILMALGVLPKQLQDIFLLIGLLLTSIGGVLGMVIGSLLIIVQQHFPFLYVPGTTLAYPVLLTLKNVLSVFFTVLVLGGLASWWATRGIARAAEKI
jgi:lipoprotein-releasing system permease protein